MALFFDTLQEERRDPQLAADSRRRGKMHGGKKPEAITMYLMVARWAAGWTCREEEVALRTVVASYSVFTLYLWYLLNHILHSGGQLRDMIQMRDVQACSTCAMSRYKRLGATAGH